MATSKRFAAMQKPQSREDVQPQNNLQSDFLANDDSSSLDSDERYLVRL